MEDVAKILVSAKADEYLEEMVKAVNQDFSSGRVKKSQLASWILTTFYEKSFTKEIKRIRAAHFDRIAHLKALVKKLEATDGTDADLELNRLLLPLKNGGKKSQTMKTPMPTPEKKMNSSG